MTDQHRRRSALVVGVVLSVAVQCSRDSGGTASSVGPSPTQPPTIGAIASTPSGVGIASATTFAFLAQNVTTHGGATYTWTSSDSPPVAANGPSASHVFGRAGTYDVRLTVADASGLSGTATVSVDVATLTGVWDISCSNPPASVLAIVPRFPTQFVASITQNGTALTGTLSGGGYSQSFPTRGAEGADRVSDPRRVAFGVETSDNIWAAQDGDFYFHLIADERLTSMTGDSQYCGSAIATRR